MKNYFSKEELACRHCGEYHFDEEFLSLINEIREAYGRPMVVSSGYRCKDHPIEAAKEKPGTHNSGLAIDVRVAGKDALDLVAAAVNKGIKRVGVSQKSSTPWGERFIHLDGDNSRPSSVWSY